MLIFKGAYAKSAEQAGSVEEVKGEALVETGSGAASRSLDRAALTRQ